MLYNKSKKKKKMQKMNRNKILNEKELFFIEYFLGSISIINYLISLRQGLHFHKY